MTLIRRPGASFNDLAESVAKILAAKGYFRLDSEPGWCWQNEMNRVRFAAPASAHPRFPYVVTRERVDPTRNGTRNLQHAPASRNFAAHESAERVAKAIEEKLQNPD